jgi:hypothetical protein
VSFLSLFLPTSHFFHVWLLISKEVVNAHFTSDKEWWNHKMFVSHTIIEENPSNIISSFAYALPVWQNTAFTPHQSWFTSSSDKR